MAFKGGSPISALDPTSDWGNLNLDGSGNLLVSVTGAGSGGTSAVDESTFSAGVTAGTPAMAENGGENLVLACDASRNLKVNIAAGAITVSPVVSSTVSSPSIVTVGTSSALLLAANASRKRAGLQNVGTTRLYVLRAASGATLSNYHFILPAGGNTADGSSLFYQDPMWQGAYCAVSSASGGSCSIEELT
jgi:hypothetical protein